MLQVLYTDQTVGQLWSEARELCFCYAASWVQAPHAFPLTPHLPLGLQPFRGDEVLFFFSNLLPEGAVLDVILKLKRLPRGDVYAQFDWQCRCTREKSGDVVDGWQPFAAYAVLRLAVYHGLSVTRYPHGDGYRR